MKVSFFTTRQTAFRGINDVIRNAAAQASGKGSTNPLSGDTFTPSSNNGGTVIIEHYHAAPGENNNQMNGAPKPGTYGNSSGSAAADGAVAGVTTGTTIEGTKAAAEKLKSSKGEKVQKEDPTTETEHSAEDTPVDMTDEAAAENQANPTETDNTDFAGDTDIDTDIDIDTDVDVNPDVDVEVDPDVDFEPEIDPEIDIDPDIDIDPEIDITPEIDIPDIDIF